MLSRLGKSPINADIINPQRKRASGAGAYPSDAPLATTTWTVLLRTSWKLVFTCEARADPREVLKRLGYSEDNPDRRYSYRVLRYAAPGEDAWAREVMCNEDGTLYLGPQPEV